MALADILTARAASARATAAVDCGALGSVTVEALPLRELERFSFGPDGDRGIFYAACRELQQAGQQLFEQGKTVRPDGVTAFLSDSEARLAADTVRRLSGWTAVNQANDASELSEVRLSSVQENPVKTGGGQVSREFSEKDSENLPFSHISDKTQKILPVNGFRAQDMGDGAEEPLHESESEYKAGLHEIKSESAGKPHLNLHETESERQKNLHETESDFGKGLHEIESEQEVSLHETESEYAEKPRLNLHETESELAERIARQLLEGLRQASWVR